MKTQCCGFMLASWMLSYAVLPLDAGSIDVSTEATAWLNPNDTLTFEIPFGTYSLAASQYRLSVYPTEVGIVFVSAPVDAPGQFDAALQSADGSAEDAFGAALSFISGEYSSSGYTGYTGPVSALQAVWHLPAGISGQIFGGSGAFLTLRNAGTAINIGLPGNTLAGDLSVTLSGGPLGVGALRGAVTFQDSAPLVTPEPHGQALLTSAGALLGLLARRRQGFS